jgi:hypothetical protein
VLQTEHRSVGGNSGKVGLIGGSSSWQWLTFGGRALAEIMRILISERVDNDSEIAVDTGSKQEPQQRPSSS